MVQLTAVQAPTAVWYPHLRDLPEQIWLRPRGVSETVLHHRAVMQESVARALMAEWSDSAHVRAGRQRVKLLALNRGQALAVLAADRAPADDRTLADLTVAAADGDMGAYGRLWDLTSPYVLARLVGHHQLTMGLAEACTAEVYQAGLQRIRDADPADPIGWLETLADELARPPLQVGRHRLDTEPRARWWQRMHWPHWPHFVRTHSNTGGY